jgi:4-hydroxythreonine-4-phosphate dehydrogenase
MKKKIILVLGDPNSINSEIIFKSLKKINNSLKSRIYLVANFKLLKKQFEILNYRIKLIQVKDIKQKISQPGLKIINVNLNFKNPFNISLRDSSNFVIKSLDIAHELALSKNVSGIINCPINKKLLKKSEYGVTEYFSSKCKIKDNSEVMLIKNNQLAVSPITTHLLVKNISKKINTKIIIKKIMTISQWYLKKLKRRPKIAILGLNPHNAELEKKTEEVQHILPAINKLTKLGINLSGPFVADTIFISEYKKFDIIVGMYHDQVIAPFKSIFKFDAINLTLGLKYIRVSPDHGVAQNLIKKNLASPESLVKCINFLKEF